MAILYSKRFQKSFLKLLKELQLQTKTKLKLFSKNINHPSLRLHKLNGIDFWSISVNMEIRVIFEYLDNDIILANIGDHNIYKKLF